MKILIIILLFLQFSSVLFGGLFEKTDCYSKPCMYSLDKYDLKIYNGYINNKSSEITPEFNFSVKNLFSIGFNYSYLNFNNNISNKVGISLSTTFFIELGISLKYLIENNTIGFGYYVSFLLIPLLESKYLYIGIAPYYQLNYNERIYSQLGLYFTFTTKGFVHD